MGKLYKAPVHLEPVSRAGNAAVRENAMRGPAPRAPELEIPRPMGAGVGALSSSLVFELGVCPECGGRIVEHSGLLVCGNCGLVASPVYAPPKLDPTANLAPIAAPVNPARGFHERAVEAVADELGLPAKAALELYARLKRLVKPEGTLIASSSGRSPRRRQP